MRSACLFTRIAFRPLALCAALVVAASAGNVTWDIVAGDSAVTGGFGIWNTLPGNWTLEGGATNIAWNNANNDTAVFGGAAGTVTLGTGITVGGPTFNDTANYYLTENAIAFGAPGTITTNVSAAIAPIEASRDLAAWTGGVSEVSPALGAGLPAAPTDYEYHTFKTAVPVGGAPQDFLRLKVTAAP